MKLTKLIVTISFAVSIILIAASTNSFAQEKKITQKELPSAVLSSFHKSYPKAEIKGLSAETEKGKKYFEIESVDGSVRRDLLYLPDGKTAEIEETIPSSGLPEGAVQSIEKKIPGGKIEHAERVTSGTKITYELSVMSKKAKYEIVLDKEGKIIKDRKVTKEENDND